MNALELDLEVVSKSPVKMSWEQGRILRRAALTLHRWFEAECNGEIQRGGDDGEGKPRRYYGQNMDKSYPIADREQGARKRIERVCKDVGLYFYIQTDPRGGTLYVSKEELTDRNYNRGVFVA